MVNYSGKNLQLNDCINILNDLITNQEKSQFLNHGELFDLDSLPVFNEAKRLLSQNSLDGVQNLERKMSELERICPQLRVLRQTTPAMQFKQIKSNYVSNPVIDRDSINNTAMIYSNLARTTRLESPPIPVKQKVEISKPIVEEDNPVQVVKPVNPYYSTPIAKITGR